MVQKANPRSKRLLTEQRHQAILHLVREGELVTVDELVNRLQVSKMTIWRDLMTLEQSGRLRRVRGGAARMQGDIRSAEPYFKSKKVIHRQKKAAIARLAAEQFVDEDDIIILEAGTTAGAMVEHLTQSGLTVITNGLGILNEIAIQVPDTTVLCCGGMLRPVGFTFVGPQAEEFFHSLRARTLFLSATGIALPEGITDPNLLEIQVKRAMADSASRIVLLMDSSKFGVRSLAPILPLERIQVLITDSETPAEFLEQLRKLQIEIHLAA